MADDRAKDRGKQPPKDGDSDRDGARRDRAQPQPRQPQAPKQVPSVHHEHVGRIYSDGWNMDSTPENAGWLRLASWSLPTDPDEFLDMISRAAGGATTQHIQRALRDFMATPAALRMPPELRHALVRRGVLDQQDRR